MKAMIVFLIAAGLVFAQANSLTPKEVSEGWISLFDGESLYGWAQEGKAQWRAADGVVTAEGGAGWLRSTSAFADCVLKLDFRTGAEGNSGVFLRSAAQGAPHETGYELQIWNQHPKFATGSLVNHIAAKKVRPAADQWHSFEVTLEADHFVVKLDGKKILDGRDSKSKIGHIGLQYNVDKKIEFRNIKLKPLGVKPLFDGKTLKGWQVVDAPKPKEPPVWSARNGSIHVEKGPGQLETEATFDDFILQLDIRTNAQNEKHHPNSGVFLRGNPKGYWSGFESQIRNEYKDGDRTQPVDFGTGALYGIKPARKVVGNDNEYFTKTVVARGRHIAIWINGYQVTDFEDNRPEGMNARKEARLAAGPISFQAHDPTTNLDFKNIQLVTLPK